MRWVIARVLPLPAPASTLTGPRSASATCRCSGSSASSNGTTPRVRVLGPVSTSLDPGGDTPVMTFTMFSTPWCGYCHRLKSQLDREGIEFETVDIEQHPEAARTVEEANGGNQTVPTLLFADG